jgi:hypothetical protein
MSEPLDYVSPPSQPLPHSELGNISLLLTGVWMICLTGVFIGLRTPGLDHSTGVVLMFVGGAVGIMLVPFGLMTAIFAMLDRTRRRTNAYVSATINGTMIMLVVVRLVMNLMT